MSAMPTTRSVPRLLMPFFASFGVETSYRRRSADVPVLRAFCVERGLFSRGVNLEKSFPNWISSLERRGKPVLLRSRFFHRDFEKITFGKTVSMMAVLERLFPNWKASFQLTCESAFVPAFDALFFTGCPKQFRPFGSSCSKRDVSAGRSPVFFGEAVAALCPVRCGGGTSCMRRDSCFGLLSRLPRDAASRMIQDIWNVWKHRFLRDVISRLMRCVSNVDTTV